MRMNAVKNVLRVVLLMKMTIRKNKKNVLHFVPVKCVVYMLLNLHFLKH